MDACASCEACEARTCLLAPLPALENHTGQAIVLLVPRRAPSNCMHAALPVAERAQASIPGRVRQAFGSDPRYRLDVGHLQSTTPRLASQRRRIDCAQLHTAASQRAAPAIKICGITSEADAVMAVQAGASFVGVIMSKPFRRHVPPEAASAIFRAVRQSGAEPVGVFVNEDAEAITQICKQAGLQTVQLHGTASRTALPSLPQGLQVIYVMHASTDGEPITVLPEEVQRLQKAAVTRSVDYILIDGMRGGSGQPYDYSKLKVPETAAGKGWILAGGLDPHNVAAAIEALHPTAVDVASGVTKACGLAKDEERVKAFVQAVHSTVQ